VFIVKQLNGTIRILTRWTYINLTCCIQ
jgi:hypothetical protein